MWPRKCNVLRKPLPYIVPIEGMDPEKQQIVIAGLREQIVLLGKKVDDANEAVVLNSDAAFTAEQAAHRHRSRAADKQTESYKLSAQVTALERTLYDLGARG